MYLYNEKVVSLTTKNKIPTINWILGNYCNYKCSYCFDDLSTGTFYVPAFDMKLENNITHLIQEFKANTNSESINFELVGGEPTLY